MPTNWPAVYDRPFRRPTHRRAVSLGDSRSRRRSARVNTPDALFRAGIRLGLILDARSR